MTSTNNINWSQLYAPKQISAWQLPAVIQDDPNDGIFRHLYLRSSELLKKISRGDDIPIWFLCCDVLDLDKDILTGTTALIFARRIEITRTASLIFDRSEGNTQDIVIFAQEVVDKATGKPSKLNVKTVGDNEVEKTYTFEADPSKTDANGFFWADKAEEPKVMEPDELEPAYFYVGEQLRLVLVTIFQLATLLSTEELELSLSQFRWVGSLAQSSPETRDLAAQANSMVMTLLSMKAAPNGALIVPMLDPEIYSESAKAFMDLLRDRQRQWDNFQSKLAGDKNWVNAAQDAIVTQQNQKHLAEQLEEQAKKTREQVLYARDIAARQISAQNVLIAERKIDLDRGIENWRIQKTTEATINLVTGVVKILSTLPTVVVAGPIAALPTLAQAAGPALGTAANLVQTGASIASDLMSSQKSSGKAQTQALGSDDKAIANTPLDNTQSAEAKVKKERQEAEKAIKEAQKTAGEGGKQVSEAILKIIQIQKAAMQMESQSSAILSSVEKSTRTGFSSYEVQGLDVVTGGEQEWDLLLVAVENTFSHFKEVNGGTAYLQEIRRLVIYGKALSQARLALAKANAQLAEMKWRRIAAEKAIAIAEDRLNQLDDQIASDETFAQIVFGRILDAKRAVYLAMESYNRAFQYFALVDEAGSPALPKITDSVDTFSSAVAKISGRELTRKALRQPPQSMTIKVDLKDTELLNQLKSHGFVTWELSQDHNAFNGFARIRFKRVRVFVEGLKFSSKNIKVMVQIATSGVYTDKIPGGNTRPFLGEVTRRNFVYYGADKTMIPAVDGDIAPRYENDFFLPTPFTIWTFKIQPQNVQDSIDLSSITGLEIEFHGEATSSSLRS